MELYQQLDGRLDIYYQGERLASYAHAPDVPVRPDHFAPAEPIVYAPTGEGVAFSLVIQGDIFTD